VLNSENGGFPPFSPLGTPPANLSGMAAGWSGAGIGDKTMSISLNLQQLAVSVIGALLASSMFISAAVGPVPVI
jgi:hypothetical protein